MIYSIYAIFKLHISLSQKHICMVPEEIIGCGSVSSYTSSLYLYNVFLIYLIFIFKVNILVQAYCCYICQITFIDI